MVIVLLEQFASLPASTHFLIGLMLVTQYTIAPRLGMWAFSLFSLPGTVAHELSHWIIAFVLGARPSFPRLIPKREGGSWTLGSVKVSPDIVTRIPITLAPVALLPLGIWYAVAHPEVTGGLDLAHVWIAGTLIAASLPSRQDWVVALPAILLVGGGYLALKQWGVN